MENVSRPEELSVWNSNGAHGLREAWKYRELFYFLAWRDIRIRYKQTLFGIAWALLQPLFTMVVFTIIFSRIAKMPTDGIPAPVFYFSALLPWLYFSSTLNSVSMSLVSNANLLTKIYFPRIILPTSAALSCTLDFLVGSTLLVGLVLYYDIDFSWTMLLWPVLFAQLLVLTLGVGAFLAALNVQFRDVKYAVPFGIQVLLFMTPVIYPTSMVPEQYQWILALNPLTGIIEGFRFAIVPAEAFRWDHVISSVVITVVFFIGALAFFRRTERAFADIV
jgi:lipopolysaccharide transport system permease protein